MAEHIVAVDQVKIDYRLWGHLLSCKRKDLTNCDPPAGSRPTTFAPSATARASCRWATPAAETIAPDGVVIKPSARAPHLLQHTGGALVFDDYPALKVAANDPGTPCSPFTRAESAARSTPVAVPVGIAVHGAATPRAAVGRQTP